MPVPRRFPSLAKRCARPARAWLASMCIALLAVASAFPAVGADTNAPVERVEGNCRFVLHRYPLTKADGEKINRVISDLVQRQSEAFGFKAPTNLQIRIRMFGRFEDFCAYGRTNYLVTDGEHAGGAISNMAGYFSPRDNEVVTWRQKDPSYLANNLLHECSHALSHHQFLRLPRWLNEGCAVFFSFPRFLRDESDDLSLRSRWLRLRRWQEEGTLPKVRAFVDQTPEEFRRMAPEQSYAVSWSLFQFLMSSADNRKVLNAMVRRQQSRRDFAPCSEVLEELYPGGVAQFEKDWHDWITRGAARILPKPEKDKGNKEGKPDKE